MCKCQSVPGLTPRIAVCAKIPCYAERTAHPQLCHHRPLHLTFGPGLNILTGETGAGKSIIIDAVSLLLGDRASTEGVRAGGEVAEIEAAFRLPDDAELAELLRHRSTNRAWTTPTTPTGSS